MKAEKIQQILNIIFYNSINIILQLFNCSLRADVVYKFNPDFSISLDYFEITFNKTEPTEHKHIKKIISKKQLFKKYL